MSWCDGRDGRLQHRSMPHLCRHCPEGAFHVWRAVKAQYVNDEDWDGLLPVQELPSFLLAMMMACLDSRATELMSANHTTYLMKGVPSSARVLRC